MMPAPAPRSPRRRPTFPGLLPVALLGLPILLAGCADTLAPQREADWRKYLPKEQAKEPAKPKPATRPQAAPPGATAPAPNPSESAAVTAPSRLIGMSDQDLRARLGTPASEREVGPARVWTWRGRDCSVDLWLYYDTSRAGFYALEQELNGNAGSAEACLGPAPAPLPSSAPPAAPSTAKNQRGT